MSFATRLSVGLLGLALLTLTCNLPAAEALGLTAAAPSYRTRLPRAAELDYELRYGLLSGSGRLDWQPPLDGPQEGRYRARLAGKALGLNLLSWVSEGTLDAAGLAPTRFTETRINRAPQTLDFDRAQRLLRYSKTPDRPLPLPAGTQDRLSWMLQLPAILHAEPALRAPGQSITLNVAGSHGGAVPWTFVVQGKVPMTRPDGRLIDALHLLRAKREPDDVLGEAWLDPDRDYLPVRVRLTDPDSRNALEFRLAGMRLP